MATTLKDIAKAAGVSVTTVSLVLNDNSHPMISAATRQRVLEFARRLKYSQNENARALRMGKTRQIGLLMFDLDTRIALNKLEAVDSAVWGRGYRTLIRNAGGHVDMEPQFIREYAGGTVEGLIIVQPTPQLTVGILDDLLYTGMPIVTLEPIEGAQLDCVTVDRQHGAYIAIKHLLDLGHKKVGLINAKPTVLHTKPRLLGYRQALGESDLAFEERLVVEAHPGYRGGYEAGKEMLGRETGVTAVFCNNDEMAIGAMKAFSEEGLCIPKDIAVIGFDDIEAGGYASVPLTTVAQPVDELADQSVAILFKRLAGEEKDFAPCEVRLKPRLVIRKSCGARNEGARG